MSKRVPACFAVLLLMAAKVDAAPTKLEDFVRPTQFQSVKISPTGEYLGVLTRREDGKALVFLRLSDLSVTGIVPSDDYESILGFTWVSPTRVVMNLGIDDGELSVPKNTGDLAAVNVDGSDNLYIFGQRGNTGSLYGRRTQARAYAAVIGPVPDRPNKILIGVFADASEHDPHQKPTVYELDTESGHRNEVLHGPSEFTRGFITDTRGFVRVAISTESAFQNTYYARSPEHPDWQKLVAQSGAGEDAVDGHSVIAGEALTTLAEVGPGRRKCLVHIGLDVGSVKKLACDEEGDITGVIYSFDHKEPIAAIANGGKPQIHLLDTEHPDLVVYKGLMANFPGQVVWPLSRAQDGTKVILLVYSDRNPGDLYLLDTKTRNAKYLMSRQTWLEPDDMAEMRPINYPTRDQRAVVHGYLTLPPGTKEPKNLPLIVHPHGGPFSIFDTWGWSSDPQVLASRGYAVLQVNYRGSGGYGRDYLEAAKYGWATTMIDDITDGVRWAIAQGYVDPKRICIYGASYGGYAALTSAEREPDLYRCAVGYAGVYDIEKLEKPAERSYHSFTKDFFAEYVAHSKEERLEMSPVTHLDRLHASLLIVHGEEDYVAPLEQAKILMRALDDIHYPYEKLIKPKEIHGFQATANRLELYQKLLAFFEKNIGAGAGAASAGAGSGTTAAPP